jgi:aryl-alcohol dehydrogenase-like predicted oxidoreductase
LFKRQYGQEDLLRPEMKQSQQQPERLEEKETHGVRGSEPTIDYFNQLVAKNTHCLLGRTGVKVSRICLGSMNFGEIDKKYGSRPGQLSEDKAHKILDKYVELGGNCIDTANFYPWFGSTVGESENMIGSWLNKMNREDIFLMTKFRLPTDPTNLNSGGLSRNNIITSVNHSLKRLRTSYVDMLMIDGWDETVNVHDLVRHLDELVRCDKIRYYGVCDVKGWQLQKLIDAARHLNLHKCVCYMGEYNLLTRGCEAEVIEVCKSERIGFFAYSPLKYGVLTDDFVKNLEKPLEGSRVEAASQHEHPNLASMAVPFEEIKKNPVFANLIDTCKTISNNRKCSIEQVSLLWALQSGFVTSLVIGVEDLDELVECMDCINKDLALSFDEMRKLNESSAMDLQYPYNTNLQSLAGFEFISPEFLKRWSLEQMSLRVPPAVMLEMTRRHRRQHPHETWHESREHHMPEKYDQEIKQQQALHHRQPIAKLDESMAGLHISSQKKI